MKTFCNDCWHEAHLHDGDWDCSGCMADGCGCSRSCREVLNQGPPPVPQETP